MEGSPGEGLIGGAGDDRFGDVADHSVVTSDLELEAGPPVDPTPAAFEVRRVDHPLGVVLTLGGELDLATAPVLQERLEPAMRGKATVIIDLSGLRFIDSSGLRMLVRAEQQLRDGGGQLVLVPGARAVHQLFELTRLDSHFEFSDSPSAALRTAPARRSERRRIPEPGANHRPQSSSTPTSED
jgi:anti-sigma B factor antagonist